MKLFQIGFVACLLCPLLLTSCKDKNSEVESGLAPKDISGKSMTIRDLEGDHVLTIQFNSNTSAKIEPKIGWNETCTYSSFKYTKTGTNSATIQINNLQVHCHDDNESWVNDYGDKNYSLIFTSQNEGTVKGSLYKGSGFFSLF